MARLRRNQEPFSALHVAGPNLVARGTGEMVGHTPAIRTEAEAIGQTFARTRELARVGSIEVHAEQLANLVAHYLHEHALVVEQEPGRVEYRHPLPRGDLLQGAGIKVVNPKVRRGLRVVLLERLAGTVPPRFHAQKQHSMSVREKRAGLPGDLISHIEFQIAEAAAVGVHQSGLAL